MEKETFNVTFIYDATLMQYLKLHQLEFSFDATKEEITIHFNNPKFLWLIAQNYGRYKEIKEIEKHLDIKKSIL